MLVVGVAALLAAGCGGSSKHSATTTATQGGHASISDTLVTRAHAVTYAREVNLTASDVPGATVKSSERESPAPKQGAVEYARCAGGVSPTRRIVDIKSPSFETSAGSAATVVKSSVEVFASEAAAARNFAAGASARGRGCLARLLPQDLQGTATGARIGSISTSRLPNLLTAGQKSTGVRIATTVTASVSGKRVLLYVDEFALVAGPAEVDLGATGISHPVATSTERQLLALLYSRAQAHKL